MKPFKTHNQQLKILRDRGLDTGDGSKTKVILAEENYYNVINGYKDLFLKRDSKGRPISPEEYINNAHVDEIYALFSFDRDLRNLLVKYLLKFETKVKSVISYIFSKEHKEPNAYLSMNNFENGTKYTKTTLKQIAMMSNLISEKVKNNGYNSIKHYIDNHNSVPLWVLVNYMTIGNMSYFYGIMKAADKNEVAKEISKSFNRTRSKQLFPKELIIHSADLEAIIKSVNLHRNVCAHEERLYSYETTNVRSSHIFNYFKVHTKVANNKLISLLVFLRAVQSRKDSQNLHREIDKLIEKYQVKFESINFDVILKEMGFLPNWEECLEPYKKNNLSSSE